VAEKASTFVDMIQEATRQRYRRARVRELASAPTEERPRAGRWPPPRQREWRLELLKPWKFRE
jgi:hypothetical protein